MSEDRRPWMDYLAMLRTDVNSAGIASWRTFEHNIVAHLEDARALVSKTPRIEEAFESVERACLAYVDEIRDRGLMFSATDPASANARGLALAAIDDLENRLQTARPSETAKALGLWW